MASRLNLVEVSFDERLFAALQEEATRLGISADQVVYRATAAWICEMADNTQDFSAAQSALGGIRQQANA